MPFSAFISREPTFKDIERFMKKELKARVRSVEKEIVKSISENALEGIKRRAPKDPKLGEYQKGLTNNAIEDQVGYAILFRGKIEKGASRSNKTTLLYIKPIERAIGKWAKVFTILEDYGPFALDTWPVKIPQNRAFIAYRDVKANQVDIVRNKNLRQADDISLKLRNAGIRLSRSDFNVNSDKLDIVEDLAFKVTRKEKGLGGEKAHPHWKPSLQEAKSSSSLNAIKQNQDIVKALSDPNFRGWKKLGKIGSRVSLDDLQQIRKFQKLIGD